MSGNQFEDVSHYSSFLCGICFGHFNKPKALPCLHTFCESCLHGYVASRCGGRVQFPCPVCRQIIYLPQEGVGSFPDNTIILGLMQKLSSDNTTEPVELPPSYQSLFGGKAFDVDGGDDVDVLGATLLTSFGSHGTANDQFTHISGLAVNPYTDDVAVADCSLNKVAIYSMRGEHRSTFFCDCSVRDVCFARGGSVFVTVSRSGSAIVREYSLDGRVLALHGSFYKYDNPCGIAVDSRQKVVIASLEKNCIHVLTDRLKPSINFGSKGAGVNHFLHPYYVAINGRNDIIVSDSGNHRVKVHQGNGQFILKFGGQGHEEGQMFYPMGVCVDRHDNIYVADANNYRVQVFRSDGVFVACPITRTFDLGLDVKPTNVAVHNDTLIVALRGSRFSEIRLYRWSPPVSLRTQKPSISSFWCCCSRDIPYDEL
ncbi:tripartite motif-containing protein 3-like [Gigantopelta aegis]|uniref:tripartite motif-containing protein 3-like n=1 Tax=Gigantopelta aegis TaxID=1735272 RepID=UPI001B8888B3|nr:tripartite motif-containing protein 3-like [Gigantopelta aegis]